MSEPSPRQVLYGLVAGGFLLVIVILVIAAAAAGLTPVWWTATMGILVFAAGIWAGFRWRDTGRLLLVSIGLLVTWMVGTILVTGS